MREGRTRIHAGSKSKDAPTRRPSGPAVAIRASCRPRRWSISAAVNVLMPRACAGGRTRGRPWWGPLTLARVTDNALGAFLRARREATRPTDVGLPAGRRRRTPGLRREELASLAGISVEYLTRLERGRDRHPSAQVIGALADALGLSPEERVHVHRMVKVASGEVCAQARPPSRAVRPTVLALLDRLEPTPALVLAPHGDVLASTAGFRRLAAPSGLFDADAPNLVRFVFADPRARAAFPAWERVADERAAALRAAADLGDRTAAALADELSITVGTG